MVELAVGGTTTLEFHAHSTTATHFSDAGTYDLSGDLDISALLADAGIDPQDVLGIKLAGVSYRVSTPDAGGHSITGGHVTVQRIGVNASPVTLIEDFSQDVGSVTPFITAPLTAAGVDVLNQLLSDALDVAKHPPATVPNPQVAYTVSGDASGLPYDFYWQLKLDVTMAGKIKKIKVLT